MCVSTGPVIFTYRRFICVYHPDPFVISLLIGIAVGAIVAVVLVVANYGLKLLTDIYWQMSAKRSMP